jgi:peptide/nickel transport system substrate-binding protein
MKRTGILLILTLILVLALSLVAVLLQRRSQQSGGPKTVSNLPRKETLYYCGIQWGAPRGYNPYMINANNLTVAGHRQFTFETLFAYNILDGKNHPQIGDSFEWSGRDLVIQINPNVKFSDGTPVTSQDVVYSFELSKTYLTGMTFMWDHVDAVVAQGDYTVIIKGKAPPHFNMKIVEQAISEYQITPMAYWERQLASGALGREPTDIAAFTGWDAIGTGAYLLYYYDETMIVLIRNDDYWGQHPSRFGKLPAPRYIAHNIYRDNVSGDEALRRGEVDVSQGFIPQVWNFFPLGVETFIPNPPYYIPGVIPGIVFNVQKPGLDDPVVRRAIAMVLDYDMIGLNAMSGYTPPKQHHLMLPTPAEQTLIDPDALKPYQWEGIDIAGANRILDQAGWVRGTDGIRSKGGLRLSFRAQCPYGWSDWNASLEIVAQSTKPIGIDITTFFPEAPIYTDNLNNSNFDIVMSVSDNQGISVPWNRAYRLMSSRFLPPQGSPNYIGNYGRWVNEEANQIIEQIANETDPTVLKQLWTRLNIIYLQEMPVIGLMYRPWHFHQVSTRVWTGFPRLGDGSNIPPAILADGYGYRGLFNIRPR